MDARTAIKPLTATGTLQVPGIDCPDCAAKIEKAVQHLPGMITVTLAFTTGIMKIEYDPREAAVPQVIEKIHALGYEAREKSTGRAGESEATSTTTIRLIGLDCADCAAKVEKSIQAIPGVKTAALNFGASSLKVTHSGPVESILAVIEEHGLKGHLDGSKQEIPEKLSPWTTNRHALLTVICGAIMIVAVIMEHLGAPIPITHAIYAIAAIIGGYLPARAGLLMALRARQLDINVLMTIAVIGAVVIGQLEEAAVVIFLFSLGNALQIFTLDKTRNAIRALIGLAPKEALVRRNGQEILLSVDEIHVDDAVIVRPGERISMDGRVIEGISAVNQAPITGESLPVTKQPGDEVFAGTVNERGSLEIRVTRLASDNTIAKIIKLVEEAQGQRAPSQQFIDKFARYYTPLVILGAVLVATAPPLLLNQPFSRWLYEALAMLLVACPCALVISTPVSIVSAIGAAARNGVLIKGGAYLEEMGAISVIAFDKTGTLTHGRPQVTDVVPLGELGENEVLTLAAGIESRSEHPLGEAIVKKAKERGLRIPAVGNFLAITGKGAQGEVDGRLYFIGNERLFVEKGLPLEQTEEIVTTLQNEGKTVMTLGDREKILGLIAVADTLRGNSRQSIENLKKVGIDRIVMLTGDNDKTARAIAGNAGVDDYKAGLLPEDKAQAVRDLLARYDKVAMVGDGVNDAPAMAVSTVGIAMGVAGSDTALETADIALMGDDLSKLPYVIELSRRTVAIIKQNVFLSLAIKAVILLLVIPGWLTLWLAVLGDMGSTLLVILNGMRLLRVRQ